MHRNLGFVFILWAVLSACAGPAAANPNGPTQPAPATTVAIAATSHLHTSTPTHAFTPTPPYTHTPTPVPSATVRPSATPCAERAGKLYTLAVPSPTLRYDIDARVYLPPCYGANQKRYPVLYLIHGL